MFRERSQKPVIEFLETKVDKKWIDMALKSAKASEKDQEKTFGEMKSQDQMDYIAVRCLCGNQLCLMASILAHNLTRELQMLTKPKSRGTTEKRSALWAFEELGTIRHHLLQRAGRLTQPHGKLTLTMNPNAAVKQDLIQFLEALKKAA